tara:strand:+ start:355 stop:543 length:189 start_codon:yes stop_codon:yes gene_type:complete
VKIQNISAAASKQPLETKKEKLFSSPREPISTPSPKAKNKKIAFNDSKLKKKADPLPIIEER